MTTRTRPSCRATPPDPTGPVPCASPRGGPFSRGRRPDRDAGPSSIQRHRSLPSLSGRGRARHAAAPIGEGHDMRNIIRIGAGTDGRNRSQEAGRGGSQEAAGSPEEGRPSQEGCRSQEAEGRTGQEAGCRCDEQWSGLHRIGHHRNRHAGGDHDHRRRRLRAPACTFRQACRWMACSRGLILTAPNVFCPPSTRNRGEAGKTVFPHTEAKR